MLDVLKVLLFDHHMFWFALAGIGVYLWNRRGTAGRRPPTAGPPLPRRGALGAADRGQTGAATPHEELASVRTQRADVARRLAALEAAGRPAVGSSAPPAAKKRRRR